MRMPSFSRNVWLRASSSNRDMLEVHLDAATGGVIRHVMSSCMDSSKVAGAKLPMRPLTTFQNCEMKQLVDALQGSFHRLRLGSRWSISIQTSRGKRWFSVFSGCTKTCLIAVAFLMGTTLRCLMQLFPLLPTSESAALR